MSLYRCIRCDVIENTATGEYWRQQMEAHKQERKLEPLCSQCLTGTWHGRFARKTVTADWVQDRRGFLWTVEQSKKETHLGPFAPLSV